jgi:cytochrome c biogenesis factor
MDWIRPFRVKKHLFTGLLHIALATIVVGACVTHFFGVQGEIHLRADQAQTLNVHHSPISLFLWDFQVVQDKDGNPVDYITELRLLDRSRKPLVVEEGKLRMNKPLKFCNYRFCQSDYDSDQQGVVLTYNYDPWGIGITYTGYGLLLLAMIAFFFQKQSYFRSLVKSLTAKRSYNEVVLQRSGLIALAVLIVILAIIMTKVVTPKPPLQPVLQTPLLGIHVSVIMLAYTLFAVIMVNGILGLCWAQKREQLMHLSQLLLYPALFCLTAGIFIGAVWANMSWGRYWGWDPKETWALITMLVYALLLHFPWLIKAKDERQKAKGRIIYHVCCVVDFALVLFTYFGVSYLLGGLHSYA